MNSSHSFGSFLMALLLATSLRAATFTVTNTNDSGPGSLRQAVADAALLAGPDTIVFAPALSGQTILLTTNDGDSAITISDPGVVTLDATGLFGGVAITRISVSTLVFARASNVDTPY